MLHTISSDSLRVVFNDELGEVSAIDFKGVKTLKEPTYGSWPKSWPVMFPICGKLKDNKYRFDGRIYEVPGHGFFRSLQWKVEVSGDKHFLRAEAINIADFTNIYPFIFGLTLEIAVAGDTFFYTVAVTNKADKDMYYNSGHHGAFLVDPAKYQLFFDRNLSLTKYMAAGGTGTGLNVAGHLKASDLDFDSDCSYQAVNSSVKQVTLHSGKGYAATFVFETFDVLTLWSKPKSDWICVEPWNGTQDIGNAEPYELSAKPLIRKLGAGQTRSDTMSIRFSHE